MTHALGSTSRARLERVHADLAGVVRRAIEISDQDFGVFEGVRTLATQRAYLAKGVTRTLASKHLIQADGFGHAVDLVPYIAGTFRWEWPAIWPIAEAMRRSAIEAGVAVRWGGVWDRKLNLLQAGVDGLKAEVAAYTKRHPGPDFLDGPHFELA